MRKEIVKWKSQHTKYENKLFNINRYRKEGQPIVYKNKTYFHS